uniref:rRNA-processing protein EFG1 n=1 Tax=Globisporangium ultimum (strain ATCC 200006 / CBS 805.95 / DAOM BR144) TaxID=431595 RepID=K3WU54_GLOUD
MAPTAGTRLRFKQAKSKKPHHAAKKIPSLKNRIRALDRFLKRGGLDDATRASKQRELKELQDEFNKKEMTEQEKQNAEKYKKLRFFERVKLMRKLKKAKSAMEKATDKAEKKQFKQEFKHHRQDLMYIYYFPKLEQYISLFPSTAHDEDKLKRQEELRAAAIARFEKEQPTDAFHQFCYNDGKAEEGSANAAAASSKEGAKHVSAADLLLKKPSKAEQKKKSKKPQNKKDKDAKDKKKETKVLADHDDDEDADMGGGEKTKTAEGDDGEEEEHDDFFL